MLKQKNKKQDKKSNFLLFVYISLLIIIVIILISFIFTSVEFEVDCQFTDIKYINISGEGNCNRLFTDAYCPHPKNIDCKIRGKFPTVLLNLLD